MRHYRPIRVAEGPDGRPTPSTASLQAWEDDLPADPDHSCLREKCVPPEDSQPMEPPA